MESGIEPSVDLDSLDERIKIREMILKGQIQEAISLINSLHPELLDTNRYLYFHLQVNMLYFIINSKSKIHRFDTGNAYRYITLLTDFKNSIHISGTAQK